MKPPRKILLVDDSKVLRRLAAVTLASLGAYEVDEADDGFYALELLLNKDYDVVITDYYMPRLDGIELASRIRRTPQWRQLPIVMITTERDPYVEREARSAGVDEFIIKPFDPADIREVLDRLLTGGAAPSDVFAIDVQSVIDSMPFPVMVLDRNHNVVLGNAAFWSDSGAGLSDEGVVCAHVMHADSTPPPECPLRVAVQTGRGATSVVREAGVRLFVEVYPMPVTDECGEPLYLHIARPLD